MIGFTYNGVHCSEFGLYYIPTEEDLWFSDPEYDVYDSDIDWRHGGIYFDSKAKVRTFTIKCFFEEIDVATRQAIKNWVRYDSNGTLIFDDMPFVYWNVHPGKIPAGNWYLDNNDKHSGTVTLTFNAYEPFGYLIRKSNNSSVHDNANDYCNMIDSDDMPSEPTVNTRSFDIYNPGTEKCGLYIELSGSTSNPIRFLNQTNGTQCVIGSLPANDIRLLINGDTGYVSTRVPGSSVHENGFAYHDKGVVSINPNYGGSDIPYHLDSASGNTYTFTLSDYTVTNDIMGANVTIGANVFTVIAVSRANNKIYCLSGSAPTVATTGTCYIQTLNHIVIQEKINNSWTVPETLSLSYILTDYKPRIM